MVILKINVVQAGVTNLKGTVHWEDNVCGMVILKINFIQAGVTNLNWNKVCQNGYQ
jgi:hypothetical protein